MKRRFMDVLWLRAAPRRQTSGEPGRPWAPRPGVRRRGERGETQRFLLDTRDEKDPDLIPAESTI